MRRVWLALVPLVAIGCDSGRSIRPEALAAAQEGFDPALARSTLTTALDAWKRGEAGGLARRAPPIRFADDDLVTGWRLVDYQLARPEEPIAGLRDVRVELTLRKASGPEVRREAAYQVATTPGLAVIRSDP